MEIIGKESGASSKIWKVKKKIDLVFGEDVEDRKTWKSIGVKFLQTRN